MSFPSLSFIAICSLVLGCGSASGLDSACRTNADCADTELCATGLCENGFGVCAARPTTCSDTDAPVCGCDGQIYQNLCFADMAGVRIRNEGVCFPTGG
ncbi:MAG: hypothetical protein WCF10_18515 [Polyangiales bacterium]